jgi:predicted porin
MKKSLIVLALAGAFAAPAFADTTVYGTLDATVADVSSSNQKSQLAVVSGGLSASRLGVKGSEDVGGGMSVVYNLEYGLDGATASTIGQGGLNGVNTRQQLLGLAGGFGTVAAGYLQTAGYDFGVKFDPTAESLVSPTQNLIAGYNANAAGAFLTGTNGAAARAQRALAYISPAMSGFKVAVNYVTAANGLGNVGVSSGSQDMNTTATILAANYDAGPLALGGVYASTSNGAGVGGSNADQHEYALGASYDAGVAKVFGTYQATHNGQPGTAGNTDKIYSLSGVVPAGGGAVAVSYAHATIDTSTNVNGSSYTGAYLYSLSKSSTVYAAYSHASNGSAGNPFGVINSAVTGSGASASSSLVALGLSKKF